MAEITLESEVLMDISENKNIARYLPLRIAMTMYLSDFKKNQIKDAKLETAYFGEKGSPGHHRET
jgi:hypothetical protein